MQGQDGYVYALIEHQSSPDKHMAFRLMRYAIDAMQHHLDAGHDKLPLVIPMLFYHGMVTPYRTDKRKNAADNWMPSRVFRGPSAYNFKHPDGRTIRLCALDSTQAEVWVHYEKLINEKKDKSTLNTLVESFFRSVDFIDLATETQKDYRKYATKLLPVFGVMHPDNIKPEHVENIWIREDLVAGRRPTGKRRLCLGPIDGGMSGDL